MKKQNVFILQSQPLHPDANHILGVLAATFNKAGAALPLFKTALEANPKIVQFRLSYIEALIEDQQFENAKQLLEQGKTKGLAEETVDALESQLASKTQTGNSFFFFLATAPYKAIFIAPPQLN